MGQLIAAMKFTELQVLLLLDRGVSGREEISGKQ